MPTNAIVPRRLRPAGFTLIELLVVVSIIGLLIGIAIPVVSKVRGSAQKVTCSSALRQLGIAMQAYTVDHKNLYPEARYMPEPFVSTLSDPPIMEAMDDYLDQGRGQSSVYQCPDDDQVYALAGISYEYQFAIGGMTLDDVLERRRRINLTADKVIVFRDFDNGEFVLTDGSTIDVPCDTSAATSFSRTGTSASWS